MDIKCQSLTTLTTSCKFTIMYAFTLSYINCKRVAIVKHASENSCIIIVMFGNLIGSVFADYLPLYLDLHTLPLIGFAYS